EAVKVTAHLRRYLKLTSMLRIARRCLYHASKPDVARVIAFIANLLAESLCQNEGVFTFREQLPSQVLAAAALRALQREFHERTRTLYNDSGPPPAGVRLLSLLVKAEHGPARYAPPVGLLAAWLAGKHPGQSAAALVGKMIRMIGEAAS